MVSRESWLAQQLDKGKLTDEVRAAYEAELDAIADRITLAEIRNKEAKGKEDARKAEFRARIEANDEDFIQTMGEEEFGSDYELTTEGAEFVVYSKVARDDQEARRPHATMEAAKADLRYLYWNRLYSRYVRNGDVENLIELVG